MASLINCFDLTIIYTEKSRQNILKKKKPIEHTENPYHISELECHVTVDR